MRKATLAAVFFLTATLVYAGHKPADYPHVGTLVYLTLTQLDHPQTYISPDGYAITCDTDGDTTDCNYGVGHPVFLITAQIKLDDGSTVIVEHEVMPMIFSSVDTLDPLSAIYDGKDGNVGNQVHYRLMEKDSKKKETHYEADWTNSKGSKKVVTAADTSTTYLVVPCITIQHWTHKLVIWSEQKYVLNKKVEVTK